MFHCSFLPRFTPPLPLFFIHMSSYPTAQPLGIIFSDRRCTLKASIQTWSVARNRNRRKRTHHLPSARPAVRNAPCDQVESCTRLGPSARPPAFFVSIFRQEPLLPSSFFVMKGWSASDIVLHRTRESQTPIAHVQRAQDSRSQSAKICLHKEIPWRINMEITKRHGGGFLPPIVL